MPDEDVTDGAPAVEERADVVMVETEVAGDMAAPALSLAAAPPASLSGTKETALPPPPMSFRDIKGDPSTDNGDAPSESSAPEKYLEEEQPLPPTAADPAAAAAEEATPPGPPPNDGEEATQSELLFLRSLGEDDCSFLCA